MKDKKHKTTPEEAKVILQVEFMKKQKACAEELNAVLDKYGLALEATKPQVVLTPKNPPSRS